MTVSPCGSRDPDCGRIVDVRHLGCGGVFQPSGVRWGHPGFLRVPVDLSDGLARPYGFWSSLPPTLDDMVAADHESTLDSDGLTPWAGGRPACLRCARAWWSGTDHLGSGGEVPDPGRGRAGLGLDHAGPLPGSVRPRRVHDLPSRHGYRPREGLGGHQRHADGPGCPLRRPGRPSEQGRRACGRRRGWGARHPVGGEDARPGVGGVCGSRCAAPKGAP